MESFEAVLKGLAKLELVVLVIAFVLLYLGKEKTIFSASIQISTCDLFVHPMCLARTFLMREFHF